MTQTIESLLQPFHWQGRVDTEVGVDSNRLLRWHQVMQSDVTQMVNNSMVLLGLASDAGVARNLGRIGARFGPNAIRAMLANLPVINTDLRLYDAGNVVCVETEVDQKCSDESVHPNLFSTLEIAQEAFITQATALLNQGAFVVGLGGGHEIAYASFMGLERHLKQITQTKTGKKPTIGIVNFDAHLDLRSATQATSGTPFKQISDYCAQQQMPFHYACFGVSEFANTPALFDRANQSGVLYRYDRDMNLVQLPNIQTQLAQFIESVDALYVTICLDVLPAAVAPGVSAPAGFGVALEVIEILLKQLMLSGKVRLMDVAECNPLFDRDHQTARVAARLIASALRLSEKI
jgi:formiminoglutamase